jgi:NAD+ synthase (glutamine-hydrolysing)
MRLALLQLNPLVGDAPANARLVGEAARDALERGASLVATSELVISGYPPRDLINQQGFVAHCRDALLGLAREWSPDTPLIVGCPWRPESTDDPASFNRAAAATNSLLVLRSGRVVARYDKRLLPTYDVFDEHRYFKAGDRPVVIEAGGVRVGLSICEDLWKGVDVGPEVTHHDRYADEPDPVQQLVEAGAQVIVNPSASPFVSGKGARQREILRRHVERHRVTVASVNQVGANDDLVFSGHSAVFTPDQAGNARLVAAAPGFEPHTLIVDLDASDAPEIADPLLETPRLTDLFHALVLGLRDYARKSGFTKSVFGISGGIDSALTAAIAAAALGPDSVLGVIMPSRYSSGHSVEDAMELAERIGMRSVSVPIAPVHEAAEALLQPAFAEAGLGSEPGITEENIQSRLRGLVVMAFSNKEGSLALTTGNKSELAVGYCTLYGDMNGGLAILSDVSKTDVFALSRHINDRHAELGFDRPPIPERSITKPPSAELRPDQIDQDSLPPYEVLDEIIERYVENHEHPAAIIQSTGFDAEMVYAITRTIDRNEYKRKQMPIGLKVSGLAFGRGRRRPLAQGYDPRPRG